MYKGHESIKNIYHLSQEFLGKNSIDRSNAKLIVDFGARHGESFEILKGFCRDSYVFVEPAPRAASVIKDFIAAWHQKSQDHARLDLELLNEPTPHLIEAIISDKPGSIEMHTFESDDDQSSNIFSDRGGRYGGSTAVTVPVVPYEIFDEMFPGQTIDFAKVNIEGAEYKMIEDGFFHQRVRSFVMELHNEHVKDRTWRNALEALQDSFDVTTHGELNYKYCFMSGVRCK